MAVAIRGRTQVFQTIFCPVIPLNNGYGKEELITYDT